MAAHLLLTFEQLRQILHHLNLHLPEEACGLVGGLNGIASIILPVENILHSPVRFRMDPVEQFRAFERIESAGLELAAIFHSHPEGPPHPSETDLAEFYYPGTLSIIASLSEEFVSIDQGISSEGWQFRAFQIENGRYLEVKLGLFYPSNQSNTSGLMLL